jgi:hypothetical protein
LSAPTRVLTAVFTVGGPAAPSLARADSHVRRQADLYPLGGRTLSLGLAGPQTAPRTVSLAIWTNPYFDAGGGEIWMITRAVPLIRDDRVALVVTTDLPVDAP